MIAVPYLLALFIGVILFVYWNGFNPLRDGISFVVAWLLGAGFFVIITFVHVFLFNGYHAFSLACTVWLSIAIIGFYGLYKYRPILIQSPKWPSIRPFHFVLFLILMIALILMMGLAKQDPYGSWGAWTNWNFRTKFIMLSSEHWKDAYFQTVQAKHPWFLPYWLIFCYTMGSMDFNLIPLVNSILLALLILTVVMFSTYEQTLNKYAAIGAGLWLASIPYFVYHSISQTADVPLALLIVVNMAWLLRFVKSPDRGKALTLGMLLGMMAFIKDEGIVSMFIMLFLILFNIKKDVLRCLPYLLGTLVFWLILLFIVKIWMLHGPSGENKIQWGHLWELNRWVFLLSYFFHKYKFIILIFITNVLINYKLSRILERNIILMMKFLLTFMVFFFLLYVLVESNLTWRLYTTHNRLIYEIYGVGIVLMCSLFFNRSNRVL